MSFIQILLLKASGSFCITSEKMSLIYLLYIATEIKQLQIKVFNSCGNVFILHFGFLSPNTIGSAGNAANPEVCEQAVNKENVCLR